LVQSQRGTTLNKGARIMTTGDAGRSFWGPDVIWSRTTDFCVKAAAEFQALVAVAILRLRGLLAEQRAAIAADAIAAGTPGGAPQPMPPARSRPLPAAEKRRPLPAAATAPPCRSISCAAATGMPPTPTSDAVNA
jgi:hypothetical protein